MNVYSFRTLSTSRMNALWSCMNSLWRFFICSGPSFNALLTWPHGLPPVHGRDAYTSTCPCGCCCLNLLTALITCLIIRRQRCRTLGKKLLIQSAHGIRVRGPLLFALFLLLWLAFAFALFPLFSLALALCFLLFALCFLLLVNLVRRSSGATHHRQRSARAHCQCVGAAR